MKRRLIPVFCVLCLLLCGCSWLDGSYVSITPHQEQRHNPQGASISAKNYPDLMHALEDMIDSGTETLTIQVPEYPAETLESGLATAVHHVMQNYPVGAYAVENIHYEMGASGGQPAVAVTISYRHGWGEIQRIHHMKNMDQAETMVTEALAGYDAGVVMLVEEFAERDFEQLVQDYAASHPQTVMETPQVAVDIYGSGSQRVVEVSFLYQNSREAMRQMQNQVKPVFDAAVLYVSGDGADWQKLSQLYGFLMERFDYKVETSLTPAYSLLRHGVGDSRAFAQVYAAMCRDAGLECMTVTGTRAGEPWTWNIVLDNGYYYHVDLLRCSEQGQFMEFTDLQMQGYVWDYSAYPECTGVVEPEPTATEPEQNVPETTIPETLPQETEDPTSEPAEPGETTAGTEPSEKSENF